MRGSLSGCAIARRCSVPEDDPDPQEEAEEVDPVVVVAVDVVVGNSRNSLPT